MQDIAQNTLLRDYKSCLGCKRAFANIGLPRPSCLEYFRSWIKSEDFLAQAKGYWDVTGDDDKSQEEVFEEIKEVGYDLYEYANRTIEVWSRHHLENR